MRYLALKYSDRSLKSRVPRGKCINQIVIYFGSIDVRVHEAQIPLEPTQTPKDRRTESWNHIYNLPSQTRNNAFTDSIRPSVGWRLRFHNKLACNKHAFLRWKEGFWKAALRIIYK